MEQSTGYDYSRLQNPTREHLEKIIATLENGNDAFAFSSGMAAITMAMELFKTGRPPDRRFRFVWRKHPSVSQCIRKKNGITFSRVDCYKEDVEAYVQDNTKAIYIETPTNPMMNVTDIRKMAEIKKKYKLFLIVDNTFLSPYFQNPLELGTDIVIHSGTKNILADIMIRWQDFL